MYQVFVVAMSVLAAMMFPLSVVFAVLFLRERQRCQALDLLVYCLNCDLANRQSRHDKVTNKLSRELAECRDREAKMLALLEDNEQKVSE